jgi:hypothetical protein
MLPASWLALALETERAGGFSPAPATPTVAAAAKTTTAERQIDRGMSGLLSCRLVDRRGNL